MSETLDETERAALIEQLARSRDGFGFDGLDSVTRSAHRRSPTCGDEFTVRVLVVQDIIEQLRWEGHGCVVSTAAAGALAVVVPGLSRPSFLALAARYFESVQADGAPDAAFGDAEVFAGIGRYLLRAGCASIAWRAAVEAVAAE
jgi:nitrogen fixation NifU-like protein